MKFNRIYNQDCMEGMKAIADESIDLVVTDPPYRITSRGNCGTAGGMFKTKLGQNGKLFEYNDIDIETYISELYRVLKEGTHCYIMCNNLNLAHFFEVIQKSKFHFTKLLVWDKQNKICGTYYMGQVEFIFFLRKGREKKINECGTSDLLSFANEKDKVGGENIHNSQKPIALMRTLIRNSTNEGDVVLDPFMGSGTTALASIQEGRKYIGYEIDPTFYDRAMKRVVNEQSCIRLF